MKFDVITIGGATEDLTFYTKDGVLLDNKKDILRQKLLAFEYGAKMKINKAHSTFGGGAANLAVSFSRLGLRSASFIAIGDDERGRAIIRNLAKEKVNISLVQKIKRELSGFSFILVGQNNEHIVFSNRAANSHLSIRGSDFKKLKNTKWIYTTSLSGNWRDVLNKIFSVKEVKRAWNPGHIQLNAGIKAMRSYLKKTTVLALNKDEAIELVYSDPQNKKKTRIFLSNIKNLLTVIKGWGPQIVVITNGKYGADVYDGIVFYHQNVIREKRRVDTTGVGDAFGSTFVAGLELSRGDIKKAMLMAAKNTASVISRQGAQNGLLYKKDI